MHGYGNWASAITKQSAETWPVPQAMEQILQDNDADLIEQAVPDEVEPDWHSAAMHKGKKRRCIP